MATFAREPKSFSPGRSNQAHCEHLPSYVRPGAGDSVQAMLQVHSTPRGGHHFGRIPLRPLPAGMIQTKLAIEQPGDECEQEAERVSEQVMRTPEIQFQRVHPGGGHLQSEKKYSEPESLQLKHVARGNSGTAEAAPILHEGLRTSGQPLDASTRDFMEARFQFNFDRVRVHREERAERFASGLSARAFTLGDHIAFGRNQYEPGTSQGRKLLAHELTHVVQQTQDGGAPVLRRAPILKGKSQQQFGESDASTIDKAIAASPITKWIPAKNLAQLKGNVDTQDPVVFEQQFKNYGKSKEDPDEIPGFVDRSQKKPIKLRLPGKNSAGQLVSAAKMEAAVHETIHLNSNTQFQAHFGHHYNEGVTQYFTELVLGEPGKAYRDAVKLGEGLVAAVGQDAVGKAYFQGEKTLYARIVKALGQLSGNTGFSDWFRAREKKPPDWQTANTLLTNALSASSRSAPVPTSGTSPSPPPTPAE